MDSYPHNVSEYVDNLLIFDYVESMFVPSYPLVAEYVTRPGLLVPRRLECHRRASARAPIVVRPGTAVQDTSYVP